MTIGEMYSKNNLCIRNVSGEIIDLREYIDNEIDRKLQMLLQVKIEDAISDAVSDIVSAIGKINGNY